MLHGGLLARSVACSALASGGGAGAATPDPADFVVREGYEVAVASADLPGARFLEFDDRGRLYVSLPQPGSIRVLHDPDGDGRFEALADFVTGRPSAHGMHFADGWLWFTTSGSVSRARDTDGDGRADEIVDVLPQGSIPSSGGHWWRPILVHDQHFYTSIGDTGNIEDETDTDRQKLWRYALDGSSRELFASGIRNTEKYRIRPGTGEIWGLDHGSDWFGRDVGDGRSNQPITDLNPPDELNHYVEGGFYGHPFVTGRRVPRYEYLDRDDLHDLTARTIPPAWEVGAHWATNGFCFVDPATAGEGLAWPAEFAGDVVLACHGSWNSSAPVGYCVARIDFDDDPLLGGAPVGLTKLVSTIGRDGRIKARPVDIAQAPDGSLVFSVSGRDGGVYRLRYVGAR